MEDNVSQCVAKYNKVWGSMLTLGTNLKLLVDWQSELRQLGKEHIHHLSEKDENETEGTRQPSWIWFTGDTVSAEDDQEALHDGEWHIAVINQILLLIEF